ncbi:beta-arrestin, partial [Clonorchis sinensis]
PPDANLPFGGEHETVTRPSVTESMETGPGPTQKQGTSSSGALYITKKCTECDRLGNYEYLHTNFESSSSFLITGTNESRRKCSQFVKRVRKAYKITAELFTDSRIDTQERGFCPSFPATTRNEKKVCLMKVYALSLKIFLPCPRRVFAGSTVKNLLAKPCSNRAYCVHPANDLYLRSLRVASMHKRSGRNHSMYNSNSFVPSDVLDCVMEAVIVQKPALLRCQAASIIPFQIQFHMSYPRSMVRRSRPSRPDVFHISRSDNPMSSILLNFCAANVFSYPILNRCHLAFDHNITIGNDASLPGSLKVHLVFRKSKESGYGRYLVPVCYKRPQPLLVTNSSYAYNQGHFRKLIHEYSCFDHRGYVLSCVSLVKLPKCLQELEGVVLIDPEYVRDRKVFTHVLAAFRYGREDLDVLGLTFRKDLYLASTQVYPCVHGSAGENDGEQTLVNPPVIVATTTMRETKATPGRSFVSGSRTDDGIDAGPQRLTRLQERLMKKLGNNAFPFYFKLPPDAPASVMLQPGPNENGKPCGVDYELRTYVADGTDDKLQKRNSVRLAIRKLTYAPEEAAPQPSAVVVKDFLMSPGSLRLEVSLDKE